MLRKQGRKGGFSGSFHITVCRSLEIERFVSPTFFGRVAVLVSETARKILRVLIFETKMATWSFQVVKNDSEVTARNSRVAVLGTKSPTPDRRVVIFVLGIRRAFGALGRSKFLMHCASTSVNLAD